jgi:hypothetical protein
MSSLPPGASLGDRKTPQQWPHLPCRRSKSTALQRLHLVVPYLWQFQLTTWPPWSWHASWAARLASMQKSQQQSQQSQSHDRVLAVGLRVAAWQSLSFLSWAMSAMFGEGGGGWPVRRRGDKDTVRRSMACKKAWQKLPVPSCCCASESKGVWGQLALFKCFCFRLCSRDICMRYLWDIYGIWYVCFFLRCLQDMYGICLICMGFLWDVFGIFMKHLWSYGIFIYYYWDYNDIQP